MPTVALPRVIRLGGGSLAEAGQSLAQLGLRRPAITTDRFLLEHGTVARSQAVLEAAGIEAMVFADTAPDPKTDAVDAATRFVREGGCDCVIGFGGGSPMDTAKAAAVLAARSGKMRALKAPHQENTPGLPIVAIHHRRHGLRGDALHNYHRYRDRRENALSWAGIYADARHRRLRIDPDHAAPAHR